MEARGELCLWNDVKEEETARFFNQDIANFHGSHPGFRIKAFSPSSLNACEVKQRDGK